MKLLQKYLFLLLLLFFSNSCLEDNINDDKYEFYESADLITYFETNTNIFNSDKYNFLVDVDEVHENIDNYLLLDIRSNEEYGSGHIQNSMNVKMDELTDTIKSVFNQNISKIIIISESGQKSAYAAMLLRLYGFPNTFSMNFGMGQWNNKFSDVWIKARSDSRYKSQLHLENNLIPKLNKTLPSISIENDDDTFIESIQHRINFLLSEEQYKLSIATIEEMEDKYHMLNRVYENSFIICNGDSRLYNIQQIDKDVSPGPLIYGGHPRTAILYSSLRDFKSSNLLLSIPPNKIIYVYSFNGQRSSYLVSYLRAIGYDVKSILYGGVSMFYNYMKYSRFEESFLVKNIRAYTYVQ